MSDNQGKYRVRALLDSGSGVNWIAKEILPYVEYVNMATTTLKVNHFGGTNINGYRLVQVYFNTPG